MREEDALTGQAVKGGCLDDLIAECPSVRPSPIICDTEQNIRALLTLSLVTRLNILGKQSAC